MAAETVDAAVKAFGLQAEAAYPCKTESLKLVGSHGWRKNLYVELIQDYGIDLEVAKHLTDTYGDRAWNVCDMSAKTDLRWPIRGRRIDPAYPYIEAEIRYATRREYAQTAVDVIARRVSLAFYLIVILEDFALTFRPCSCRHVYLSSTHKLLLRHFPRSSRS
jgi:glycerol-3-phosphate dehydrogenase